MCSKPRLIQDVRYCYAPTPATGTLVIDLKISRGLEGSSVGQSFGELIMARWKVSLLPSFRVVFFLSDPCHGYIKWGKSCSTPPTCHSTCEMLCLCTGRGKKACRARYRKCNFQMLGRRKHGKYRIVGRLIDYFHLLVRLYHIYILVMFFRSQCMRDVE